MTNQSETTWLSPGAAQKLREELERLVTVGRTEAADRIAEARSHGDIRENADYDAAKNEQGLMEARIRKIRHLLDTAEIREVEAVNEVAAGCIVMVEDAGGKETEFFVAAPENKVAGYLLASPTSPLGTALLGAKVGDAVEYEAPGGTFTYKITAIRPFDG